MSNKLRWSKFFWADWADDPALALCSHAAQGIWMRLLCIAAQGTPYGHVTINGKPPSAGELARLMRPPMRARDMQRVIDQLLAHGVAKLSPTGALLSPRMSHDWTLSHVRAEAAKSRWNKEKSDRAKPGLHMQTDAFAMHLEAEAEAEADTHTPPTPSRGAAADAADVCVNGSHPQPKQTYQRQTSGALAVQEILANDKTRH